MVNLLAGLATTPRDSRLRRLVELVRLLLDSVGLQPVEGLARPMCCDSPM